MGGLLLKTLKITSIAFVLAAAIAVGIATTEAVIAASGRVHPLGVLGHSAWLGSDIGVSLRDVDESDMRREKLVNSGGVVIEGIRADGPAAHAGFRAGDVVISVDGETVRSARHLTRLVQEMTPRHQADMTAVRGGERVVLKVTPQADELTSALEEALDSVRHLHVFRGTPRWRPAQPESRAGRIGADVQDLTADLAAYFGVKGGALVTSVSADTPAKTAGLRAGDVIVKVDGHVVSGTDQMRQQLAQSGAEVTLLVVRERHELTLKAAR